MDPRWTGIVVNEPKNSVYFINDLSRNETTQVQIDELYQMSQLEDQFQRNGNQTFENVMLKSDNRVSIADRTSQCLANA